MLVAQAAGGQKLCALHRHRRTPVRYSIWLQLQQHQAGCLLGTATLCQSRGCVHAVLGIVACFQLYAAMGEWKVCETSCFTVAWPCCAR